MLSTKVLAFLLIQLAVIASAWTPPPQKCKLSDSGCLKSVAQQMLPLFIVGMPDLNINPLDVMFIEKHKMDVSGLKLAVTNVYVTGLKNSVIKSLSFDMGRKMMKLAYNTDLLVNSKYKASGQLLVLPISGNGDMYIDLKNLHVDMTFPFEIVNKNGKNILELKSYQYTFDVKKGAHYNLTNLFDGNQQLSNTLISFMNDNWKILTVEFGRPMLESVQKRIFEAIKTYLKSQPVEDIVDN